MASRSDVRCLQTNKMERRSELVNFYCHLGMSYNDIFAALAMRDGTILSRRTLLRILKDNRLNRRKEYSDLGRVIDSIQEQLQGPGKMHGYRWMFTKCQEKRPKANFGANSLHLIQRVAARHELCLSLESCTAFI